MRNDEDEEPLEAQVLRARMNTRVPPVERNKNMKILDMLSADVGEKVWFRKIGEDGVSSFAKPHDSRNVCRSS